LSGIVEQTMKEALVPEITDRAARDLAINKMLTELNSLFRYEPISELDDVRRLVPTMTEEQFDEVLRARHNRIMCSRCKNAARYWERMKKGADSLYKKALCIVCMEREAEKFYQRMLKRSKDPNEGRYKITALQARMKAKGIEVANAG
jgi:hypothetical protein